jgi:hypothetical protein
MRRSTESSEALADGVQQICSHLDPITGLLDEGLQGARKRILA